MRGNLPVAFTSGVFQMRTFVLNSVFLLILVLVQIDSPVLAQDKKPMADPRPSEADNTSLIPSAIKDYEITLDLNDTKLPIRVQYAVQGQTIFVLPTWVAGNVERVIETQATRLKPDDRVLPFEEKRSVRFNVVVRNLLDIPESEKTIIELLRKRVIDQQGLDASVKFKIERPNINPAGIRFTLIGGGRGDDSSPAEIAVANPVTRPSDGVLSFTLDPVAIRKIEKDRGLNTGLVCAALSVLPTGPMKVRFERLEMDAQVRYLRATMDDFRKRVGSMVNPSTGQSPDFIIPMGNSGAVEIRNQLRSMLVSSLQVTVSTRQGVTELPLMPFLEKAVDAVLESTKLDILNDQQRVTFLMDHQVTITATLGEVKRLTKLEEKGRTEALRKASDHYYASRKGENSSYTGNLNVGFRLLGGSVSGENKNSTVDENDKRTKEESEHQKQAYDKLLQEFEGKVPTLTGIQIDDQTLAASTKQAEARFQQNTFIVDYTLHRFTPLQMSGAAESGATLSDMIRQYAILKADHEALLKLLGMPKELAEAKANLERVAPLSEELKQKSATFDSALATFEKNSKEVLAKVDQDAVAKLQKEFAELKIIVETNRVKLSELHPLADYTKAIELDPKSAMAYINRGVAYAKLKQYEKAIADFTRAIELDPKSASVYIRRGYAYVQLNQYDKAITDYNRAIELDPKSAKAYNNR